MYEHTQTSQAWILLLIIGLFCLIQFLIFAIILPCVGEYWGLAIGLLFMFGIIYIWTWQYYRRLTVETDDNSLQVFLPDIRIADPCCLSKRALERGVRIPFQQILWYKMHHKEPGTCCYTGTFAGGMLSDPVPVYWNINERELCGFDRHWNPEQFMIELHLKEPIIFGDCPWFNDCVCCGYCNCCKDRCECQCARHSHTLRISTDDLSSLVRILDKKGIRSIGNDALTRYDGVELKTQTSNCSIASKRNSTSALLSSRGDNCDKPRSMTEKESEKVMEMSQAARSDTLDSPCFSDSEKDIRNNIIR